MYSEHLGQGPTRVDVQQMVTMDIINIREHPDPKHLGSCQGKKIHLLNNSVDVRWMPYVVGIQRKEVSAF